MNKGIIFSLPYLLFFACVEVDTKGMCVSFVNREKIMDHHKERERDTCFCLSD